MVADAVPALPRALREVRVTLDEVEDMLGMYVETLRAATCPELALNADILRLRVSIERLTRAPFSPRESG